MSNSPRNYDVLKSWKSASTTITGVRKSSKSVAQVETLVVQPSALLKSGGLKPKNKQAAPINIRLTAEEKKAVQEKARSVGLSVHALLKCLALGPKYDIQLRRTLMAVNRELTAQGRNLNQIAKWANSGVIHTEGGAINALEVIRVPLMRALLAVKSALSNGNPQP